jgi:hypothetical protein
MKSSTDYRMIILADRGPMEFPMFDFAQQVNGEWLSLLTGKTAEQMNSEAAAKFWQEIEATGSAELRLVKLVSMSYGERLCRAYDKTTTQAA